MDPWSMVFAVLPPPLSHLNRDLTPIASIPSSLCSRGIRRFIYRIAHAGIDVRGRTNLACGKYDRRGRAEVGGSEIRQL